MTDRSHGPDLAAEERDSGSSAIRIQRRIRPEPLTYVPALDGLRAIAVIAVMLYHARFGWIPGGFLGVSAFFTLSGFLITSLLLREWCNSSTIDFRSFWGRRFRRLLPASWVTMGAIVAVGAAGGWNGDQLRALRGDLPFSLIQVVNWHFVWQDRSYGAGFIAPSPMEHFWSLAVEEQFYVILPVLVFGILALGKRRIPRHRVRNLATTLAALVVLGAVLNGFLSRSVSTDRAYFGTDTRMAEMLIGSLLACLTLKQLRIPQLRLRRLAGGIGIAGLLISAWLWNTAQVSTSWMYPWGLLLSATCTAAIILAAMQDGLLAKFLAVSPLVWLGKVSYGVYLLHWPVFLLLTPARTGLGEWPLFGVRAVVTLAAATLMFHFIEDPIRRRRLLPERRLALAGCLALAVLLLSLGAVTRDPTPTSAIQRAVEKGATTSTIPDPPVRVMVLGDQYATAMGNALTGDDLMPVGTSVVDDCGLAISGWVQLTDGTVERDVERCRDTIEKWKAEITAQQPDVVLVSPTARDAMPRRLDAKLPWLVAGTPEYTEVLSGIFNDTLDSLSEAAEPVGAKIVVATSPPVDNRVPAPLPPRVKTDNITVEGLHAEQERRVRLDQPAVPDQATRDARMAQTNEVLEQSAASRSVRVVDLAAAANYFQGGTFRIDLTAVAPPVPTSTGEQLRDWLRSEIKGWTTTTQPAAAAPRSPDSIELPAAPPARARRHTPAGQTPQVLAIGDSVAMSIALGLGEWSSNRKFAIANGSQLGCPIARGGMYKFQRDTLRFADYCEWSELFPKLIAGHRPDVVMLSSGIWEVVDRQLVGDNRYRHLGDPLVDKFVLAEFLAAVDVLGSDGATVAILTQPHIQSGLDQGFQGLTESDPARMDRLNEILHQVVELRPDVAVLIDLRAWLTSVPGRETDPGTRPDGIHYTDAAALKVARWLGPQLISIAKG